MDVVKALAELYQEKRRLDFVIGKLEAHQQRGNVREIPKPAKKRGRKCMGPQERREVSLRMADYWATRKAASLIQPQRTAAEPLAPPDQAIA